MHLLLLFALAAAVVLSPSPVQAGGLPINPLEGLFVLDCSVVYHYCKKKIRSSGQARPLTDWQRQRMALFFGDKIKGVEFRFGAKMQEFKVKGKSIGAKNIAGQSFGGNVYIKSPQMDRHLGQLRLLAHEMVHVLQYRKKQFPVGYCRAVWKARLKYDKIKHEIEAMVVESQFAAFQKALSDEMVAVSNP